MTSFTAIDKEKIDLLLKKALGFRYTTSSLIPGQENFQTSFILNEQIFSKKLPIENALSYNGIADTTYTQNGGQIASSYPMSVPSGFEHIKKYTNVRMSVVPGTENRAWEPFTVTSGTDADILKTKATQSIIGNAKFKFLLSVDGVTFLVLLDFGLVTFVSFFPSFFHILIRARAHTTHTIIVVVVVASERWSGPTRTGTRSSWESVRVIKKKA